MPDYAILRQFNTPDDRSFRDIETMLKAVCHWNGNEKSIPQWAGASGQKDARQSFSDAASFLTKVLGDSGLLTVIVDEVDPFDLQPLTGSGWSALIAMLILAFPEVQWVFRLTSGCPCGDFSTSLTKEWQEFSAKFGITSLFENRSSPLFDGYGLRQWIREQMAAGPNGYDELPKRQNLAVVLDEECAYSHFEAYMAYARGFRVHAIASWSEAVCLLGPKGSLTLAPHEFLLSLEDWYLDFPDQDQRKMSNLEHRAQVLNALSRGRPLHRRFITVAHRRHSASVSEATAVNAYLRDLRLWERAAGSRVHRSQQVIRKPASGLYSLWNDLGLKTALRGGDGSKQYRGLAPKFVWPPQESRLGENQNGSNNKNEHSSPGRLKEIAEHLLNRAGKMLAAADTVLEAVHGAILATQALELLGSKTPTLSLTALSLKHELEAIAECQFLGTQVHFDVAARLVDLQAGIESVGNWFGATRREHSIAMWNAELGIINRLIDVFKRFNQFDEEQVLQSRARHLHRKLWFAHRPWCKPVEIVPWYVEKVITSFPLFLAAIVGWSLWMGLLFVWAGKMPMWDRGMADAFATIFSMQPPGDEQLWKPEHGWNLQFTLILFTVVLGFSHLGIFISHLYSIITRK